MENKHFKANAGQLVTGILLLLFALIIELGIVFGSQSEDERVILIIACNIFMVLPIAFGGFMFVSTYFTDCKNIKKALEKYGEDKIKAHISSNLQKEYSKKGKSVYFTDKVIVDFTQGVIPYNMIAYAHLTNVKSKYNTLTSITARTYDDEMYTICEKIAGKEGEEYLLFLAEKNNNIMLGYSEKNDEVYNKLTEQYKNGDISISDVVL